MYNSQSVKVLKMLFEQKCLTQRNTRIPAHGVTQLYKHSENPI